jgi:hypothetical protein
MKNTNKVTTHAQDAQIIRAIGEHFKGSDVFTLSNVDYKAKEIQSALQARIDAAAASAAARTQWVAAVAEERKRAAERDAILDDLRPILVGKYGVAHPIVSDFGFAPKKRRAPDMHTAAAAVDKRAATRTARGTMGKRKKESIKGVVVSPDAAPPAARSPAPAGAGSTGTIASPAGDATAPTPSHT